MILSIVVPVYNVERFVERCIRSFLSQDMPSNDYEVIIVNDGSTDNSLSIVESLVQNFYNYKIVSKPNGGLSSARNTGIKHAKGDYIMLVDSDDWIAENCLLRICDKLVKEKPDCLLIRAANVIRGEVNIRYNDWDENSLSGKELLKNGVAPCAPFAIWSSDFLKRNSLEFYEGIFHEDSEFTPRAYYLANKITFYKDLVYYYYQNDNSITRVVNPKRAHDLINYVCKHLSEFAEKSVADEYMVVLHNIISLYFNNALDYICKANKKEQRQLNDEIYNNKCLLHHLTGSSILKYRIEGRLMRVTPSNCVLVFKLMKMPSEVIHSIKGFLWK